MQKLTAAWASLCALVQGAPEQDRVTELIGQQVFDTYGVYSGYVPIPDTRRQLHYMFVES